MIYLIIGIILLTVIQVFLVKDILKIIRIESIILIISGYLMIILNYILRSVINNKISFINISKITGYILRKSINRGLILILIGGILLMIYGILIVYRKYRNNNSII